MSRLWRVVCTVLAACALLAVFFLYSRPDFLVRLSNQLWGCF
jgi:hypothetical protein